MPEQPDLKVTNLRVSHQPVVTAQGTQVRKLLQYNVGPHGPFFHQYDGEEGTAVKMKSDIAAQVAELADLHATHG